MSRYFSLYVILKSIWVSMVSMAQGYFRGLLKPVIATEPFGQSIKSRGYVDR